MKKFMFVLAFLLTMPLFGNVYSCKSTLQCWCYYNQPYMCRFGWGYAINDCSTVLANSEQEAENQVFEHLNCNYNYYKGYANIFCELTNN